LRIWQYLRQAHASAGIEVMMRMDSNDERDPALEELKSTAWMLRLWGGDRPIHPSTLWRRVRNGEIPPPRKIGKHSVRWVRSEQIAARDKLINGE
jgi:hypothetical protein